MSFRPNDLGSRQTSFFDISNILTERKREALKHSWASYFRNDILPNIDEEPYRVLYDEEGGASRPNSPVNVLIGASVLMMRFGISEDELEENICLDIRYSYALSLDTLTDDAFSMRTLRRFRKRCADYAARTGKDLIKMTSDSLAERMASIMGIDKTRRRMDSFMVDMSAQEMTRRELVYNANKAIVSYLFSIGDTDGIKYMEHYTVKGDHHQVLYHVEEKYRGWRDEALLKDAFLLMGKCAGKYSEEEAYKLFRRIIDEQAVEDNGKLRWRTRDDGGFNSGMAQSTTDTDATYRSKAGESYKGYVANVEESVGDGGSLITHYSFEKNNVSDQAMLRRRIEEIEPQEKKTVIVADGAYDSEEARSLAEEKNIEIITTDLLGGDVDPVMGGFKFNDDGTEILSCPLGNKPDECVYNEKTGQCEAKFICGQCDKCMFRNIHCKPSGKKDKKVKVSKSMAARARRQAEMATEKFKEFYRFRNGVEAIPSCFRNILNVDFMQAYGKIRNSIAFGLRVMAFNMMKLVGFRKKQLVECA